MRPTLHALSALLTMLLLMLVVGSTALAQSASPAPTSAPSQSGASPTATPTARPTSTPRSAPAVAEPQASGASTPRRALQGFARAAEARDFKKAAEWIDLRGLPRGKDVREGPELAAMLYRLLVTRVSLDGDDLPDEPAPAGIGPEGIVLDRVVVGDAVHVFALTPVKLPSGETRWQFSKSTAQSIRPVYDATQQRIVEEAMPAWLKDRTLLSLQPWQWLGLLVLAAASYVVGRVLGRLLLGALAKATLPTSLATSLWPIGRAARLALATATFQALLPYLLLPAELGNLADRVAVILYILAIAWSLILLIRVATTTWEARLPADTHAELENRGLRTRLAMIRRIATVLVGVVATGVILLQFQIVRNIGLSLLASAGIAGVLVGIAAQRTLGGVIAGVELSITQPIRIGDVVVFRPGELGTVEQVFFTYVIVRLWDDRRLIVPVTKVMSEPFENWTRSGASLLAPVEIFVDYAMPITELREEWSRLCEASERWDRRVCSVEVIEATDRAVRVRGIASVEVATQAHALKCELREGWLAFVRAKDDGRYLPFGRVESRERGTQPDPLDTTPEAGGSSPASGASPVGPAEGASPDGKR